MHTFLNFPRLLRGVIILVNPDSAAIQRLITLQFNPETLMRSLQVKGLAAESGECSEALRHIGPQAENIALDAAIYTTAQLRQQKQFYART